MMQESVLENVRRKTRLAEGTAALERMLIAIHFQGITATKELARLAFLPVPVAAAARNELVKAGLLKRDARLSVTQAGVRFIGEELGYRGIDQQLFGALLSGTCERRRALAAFYESLETVLAARPQVDVTLDQSKATTDTVAGRALLALINLQLVGKSVLCLGDDDLVSVGMGLLLKTLFPETNPLPARITVIDIDKRFLEHIATGSRELPVHCLEHDLRCPLPQEVCGKYHTVMTDPPYTLPGLRLFLTRARAALLPGRGQTIFLSFAHKDPHFTLEMHRQISSLGLVPVEVIPGFNRYEGAEIIGNQSQLLVLKTAEDFPPEDGVFNGLLYTGEIRKTVRLYECLDCGLEIRVGQEEVFTTIEALKHAHCPQCRGEKFALIERKSSSTPTS